MPLAACRECGHDVSTEATSCPHCGVPSPSARQAAPPSPADASAARAPSAPSPFRRPPAGHPQPASTTQTVTARSSAARVEASQNRVLWGIVCAVLVLIGVAILAVRTDSLNLLLVMVVALTIFALMVIKSARRPDMY